MISALRRCRWKEIAAALFLGGLASFYGAEAQEDKTRFIQVSETKMRAEPQFWAPGVADLKYGQSITVVADEAGWIKARTEKGEEGFIPVGAVTLKKVVLSGGEAPIKVRADDSDLVLAGKGFSEGLERGLAETDASFNFAAVDAAEKRSVDSGRVLTFIRDGKLAETLN